MQRARYLSHLAPALLLGAALGGCGSDDEAPLIWPIGGTEENMPLSSTFGPRIQKSRGDVYDFHRGIDIPVPAGTPVYAIAAGRVTRVGRDSPNDDIVVQVEHCRSSGKCFYSDSIHLALPLVKVGDLVDQGDQIGYSGIASSSRFPHLHFEIRDGQPTQEYGVHPLRFLPNPSWFPPSLSILSVDVDSSAQVTVEVEVAQPSVAPGLVQVSVTTSERASGTTIEERVFDSEAWNYKYTNSRSSIDNRSLAGIRIEPEDFNAKSSVYTMRFRFNKLGGTANRDDLEVTARAVDVNGNQVEVRAP